MTTLIKRGNVYHFATTKAGERIRCSLGVSDTAAAKRLANRVEFALADGPKSPVWGELRPALPAASYETLTRGLKVAGKSPSLKDFERGFGYDLIKRTQLGQIAASTAKLYSKVADSFLSWAAVQGAAKMDEIFPEDVGGYLLQRKREILARNPKNSARSLETESRILQAIFEFAVKSKAIAESPATTSYKAETPADEPDPYSADELQKMDETAGDDRLIYLLLRWTGMRVSDVASLTWSAVDFDKRTLTWLTQKRKKLVCVPLSDVLTAELEKHKGVPGDKIIPAATRARLYATVKALGQRAGVENAHPHRFRHTFACTVLERGGSIYDLAQILGDQVATVEKYYGKFTDQARERIRTVLSKGDYNG